MVIAKYKKTAKANNGVVIEIVCSDSNKVLIAADEGALKSSDIEKGKGVTVIRSSSTESKMTENGLMISQQGEYEVSEVFVSALAIDPIDGHLDLVEVESEGVRVLSVSQLREIPKEKLSDLGVIDVLLMELVPGATKDQAKLVNAVDPQIVLPFGDDEALLAFKSELEVNFEEQSKLKVKQSDFATEEYVLRGVILS